MDELKITAVMVLYNRRAAESGTIARLRKREDVGLLLVDNSDVRTDNSRFCAENGVPYLSMQGNKGLSRAYNAALDRLFAEGAGADDVVVLLDDDTDVPGFYFDLLRQALAERPEVDIFAPVVRGQDGVVYSPNSFRFLKNRLLEDPRTQAEQDSFNAVNSGLAVRMRVFRNYRYNEALFLDEVDHCFCREQRLLGRKFGVLDIVLDQQFHQRGESLSPDSAWRRLRIRIPDIFRHARLMGGGRYTLQAFLKGCGLGVQMAEKCGSAGVALKAGLLSLSLAALGSEAHG